MDIIVNSIGTGQTYTSLALWANDLDTGDNTYNVGVMSDSGVDVEFYRSFVGPQGELKWVDNFVLTTRPGTVLASCIADQVQIVHKEVPVVEAGPGQVDIEDIARNYIKVRLRQLDPALNQPELEIISRTSCDLVRLIATGLSHFFSVLFARRRPSVAPCLSSSFPPRFQAELCSFRSIDGRAVLVLCPDR